MRYIKNTKNENAITLIALVITIIVLLILAGISISMLTGDNGILGQAGNAKTQTEIAEEKEIVKTASLAAISKEKYGELTKDKLEDELNNYPKVENVEQIDAGVLVNFRSGRVYLVDLNGNISKYSEITVADLVVKNGDIVVEDESKSVALDTALTINFTASIPEGSITSISPALPYTTDGTEISKTFTITGTGGITKQYTVNLRGYYNIPALKVGDFVNYKINTPTEDQLTQLNTDIANYSGATGNSTKTAEGSTLLCRVLEIDDNGNPTKLISANGVNSLKLYGADGYNNAVYLIDKMCETLYSGDQGTTKNLKIEDLENYFSSATISARNNYIPKNNASGTTKAVKYGHTQYYLGKARYPNIAIEEKNMGIGTTLVNGKNTVRTDGLGLSEQDVPYTGSGNAASLETTNRGITVTQTYYQIELRKISEPYKSTTLRNIMHNSPTQTLDTEDITNYWLSSRSVSTTGTADYCYFSVRWVNSTDINAMSTFYSSGTNSGLSTGKAVRPVITLNSGIQAEYVGKYNDTYNTWELQ